MAGLLMPATLTWGENITAKLIDLGNPGNLIYHTPKPSPGFSTWQETSGVRTHMHPNQSHYTLVGT